MAAGRYTSAATNSALRPCSLRCSPSLAVAVVLPAPCRPAISTTVGSASAWAKGALAPPITSTSSLCTSWMNCWSGVMPRTTSAPRALLRTSATKSCTTCRLTSASSRALLTFLSAPSTLVSLMAAWPLRPRTASSSRWESSSNISCQRENQPIARAHWRHCEQKHRYLLRGWGFVFLTACHRGQAVPRSRGFGLGLQAALGCC